MKRETADRPDLEALTLEEIPGCTFALLEDGVVSASSPFHTPVIATLGEYGPVQRTVVLRHVDASTRLVVCHTDRRTAKAREIVADPRMSWLVYDAQRKLQVKLHGVAAFHSDDALADACWERSAARSRSCYNTGIGPGRPAPRPPPAPSAIGADREAATARSHFAAIACRVEFIDWLRLSGAGHRRAFIEYDGEHIRSSWVTP